MRIAVFWFCDLNLKNRIPSGLVWLSCKLALLPLLSLVRWVRFTFEKQNTRKHKEKGQKMAKFEKIGNYRFLSDRRQAWQNLCDSQKAQTMHKTFYISE